MAKPNPKLTATSENPPTASATEPQTPLEETILSAQELQKLRVAELEAERDELQQRLAEVQQRRHALQTEELRLSHEIDTRTEEIDRLAAPQSTTEEIQAYIAQQQAVRAARAARVQHLIDAGVSPDELRSVAAPIDKRLAARRPTDRPKALAV